MNFTHVYFSLGIMTNVTMAIISFILSWIKLKSAENDLDFNFLNTFSVVLSYIFSNKLPNFEHNNTMIICS